MTIDDPYKEIRDQFLQQGKELAAMVNESYREEMERAAARNRQERLAELDYQRRRDIDRVLAPIIKHLASVPPPPIVIPAPSNPAP
jgi:hypothetical protein